jgi:hypothetical protein
MITIIIKILNPLIRYTTISQKYEWQNFCLLSVPDFTVLQFRAVRAGNSRQQYWTRVPETAPSHSAPIESSVFLLISERSHVQTSAQRRAVRIEGFHRFPPARLSNVVTVSQVTSQSSPFISFPIHHSIIILPCDAIHLFRVAEKISHEPYVKAMNKCKETNNRWATRDQ